MIEKKSSCSMFYQFSLCSFMSIFQPLKHSGPPTKNNFGKGDQASMADFSCRPLKINWVLAGPGGNMWSPFMGESMVPESVKQKWSETFISAIHEGSLNPPGF